MFVAYRSLWLAACYTAGFLVLSLAALPFDTRLVAGINPWIKPIKFEVSILVYLFTVAWLLVHLPGRETARRRVALGIAVAMGVEITAIVLQAARGVKSHFNEDTALDAAIFGVMGLMILLNTILVGYVTGAYWMSKPDLPPAVVWGIRLGLVLFLMASCEGGLLVHNRAHTVGALDGGPGLFFLNWSVVHGDLRVAHFAGMHGIQILPLVGWVLSRKNREAGTVVVVILFVVQLVLFVWTLQQALSARPLLTV
ncbi:MAG: hypothetical protein U0R19_00180 [Bryobacteraceae bacterium]